MARQARDLSGPPHHIQRLTTMAAMAIAIAMAGMLAAMRTEGWRIPAWCSGAALMVFGLASIVFPDYRGSAGSAWGALAIVGGALFVLLAEGIRRRSHVHTRMARLDDQKPAESAGPSRSPW
jgi:hypothetical protein